MKNIYVFGSTVRGEIDKYSDLDLLLITDAQVDVDTDKYSIYSPDRIRALYNEGNPFAWHLYYESKLIYSDDVDFLKTLKNPNIYKNGKNDLLKFQNLYLESFKSINYDRLSLVFDLAMIFLSLRNFATCYSLLFYDKPVFSRNSFEKLFDFPLLLEDEVKNLLMMSRISSTRGIRYNIEEKELTLLLSKTNYIEEWFNKILKSYESRV